MTTTLHTWLRDTYDEADIAAIMTLGAKRVLAQPHGNYASLYHDHREAIWTILIDIAGEHGHTIWAYLERNMDNVGSADEAEAALCYLAAEAAAYDLVEGR